MFANGAPLLDQQSDLPTQLARLEHSYNWLYRTIRYSLFSGVGLGAFMAFLYVDQYAGYSVLFNAALVLALVLVGVCLIGVVIVGVMAVQIAGWRGLAWMLRGNGDVSKL
jgi:hypothetical protein